jgi:hypothetical protein
MAVLTSPGLVKEFVAKSSNPNEITLTFKKPDSFSSDHEIVICRRKDSFPLELYNDNPVFNSKVDTSGFTDVTQVEIYRAQEIIGQNGIGSNGKLEDNSTLFPDDSLLTGRILRDSSSHCFRIISNTTHEILVSGVPSSGAYVVLADFPNSNGELRTGTISTVGITV